MYFSDYISFVVKVVAVTPAKIKLMHSKLGQLPPAIAIGISVAGTDMDTDLSDIPSNEPNTTFKLAK